MHLSGDGWLPFFASLHRGRCPCRQRRIVFVKDAEPAAVGPDPGLVFAAKMEDNGVVHHLRHIFFPEAGHAVDLVAVGIVVIKAVVQRANPLTVEPVDDVLVREK